jgi:uncharacterized protein (TIGR03067 family)
MPLKSFTALAVFLVLAPLVPAADAKAGDLDGTWLAEKAELAGQKYPDEFRKSLKLVIDGDKYTGTAERPDRGTLKVDASARPKAMDITGTDGPNKGKTFPAIYEHDGDTLRICYDLSGKARPTTFATKPGTKLFLVTYKRAKP